MISDIAYLFAPLPLGLLLLGTALGMLASLPGTAPATGELRLTLGFHELNDGLKLLPVLIGLFAINQAIQDILRDEGQVEPIPVDRTGMIMKWRDWQAHATNLARSSIIGTWVGILPGIGANIGSIMAYAAAKKLSPCPEQFGQGSEAGIVAAESANKATVGGALIPLIAMGIPGSVIDDGYSYWKFSHAPRDDWPEGHDYAQWVRQRGGDLDRMPGSPLRVPPEFHQTTWASDMALEFLGRERDLCHDVSHGPL